MKTKPKPTSTSTRRSRSSDSDRQKKADRGACNPACTAVVQFMTDREIEPNMGISIPPFTETDGYRHIHIFVTFNQAEADEPPVDLGVSFAFDTRGTMRARRYVNLDHNVSSKQSTHFIEVSGQDTWHGPGPGISSYMVRLPVMGPFVQVFIYNRAPVKRTVSVWGYLVS